MADVAEQGDAGGARQDLGEAQGIHELLFRDPSFLMDNYTLHQGQYGRAAIADRTDVEGSFQHFKESRFVHYTCCLPS
jgi:hypothetical protein